jgi:hypothetical protein
MAKAPVKKKAPAKKAVAKKKTVVKKPVKKAVAKKKAPVKKAAAKRTVAKKAVVKRAATKKKAPVKKAVTKKRAVAPKAVSYAPTNEWLTKEPELPVFLQTQNPVPRKLPIATQEYGNNKKQSPKFALAALVALLAISGGSAYFLSNDKSVDAKTSDVSVVKDSKSEGPSSKDSQIEVTATPTPVTSATAKPSKSANNSANESSSPEPTENPYNEVSVQSPRTFSSVQIDQGAMLEWLAPKNMGRVIAFELYAKEDGQSSWTLISTVTTEQLEFEIELTPSESNSQFRVASLLSTSKKVFNPTTITLPGSLT